MYNPKIASVLHGAVIGEWERVAGALTPAYVLSSPLSEAPHSEQEGERGVFVVCGEH